MSHNPFFYIGKYHAIFSFCQANRGCAQIMKMTENFCIRFLLAKQSQTIIVTNFDNWIV